jgi:excisionase family DNA binding protein
MSTSKTDDEYLSVNRSARHMAVSDKFLWKLIYSRAIPSYRFGRAVRLRKKDLDEYIARSVTPAVR